MFARAFIIGTMQVGIVVVQGTLLTLAIIAEVARGGDVIYAVNAGGDQHVDSNGIHYIADQLKVGTASNYGQRFQIRRVSSDDQSLYQTERWHDETFGYDIPIKDDGEYVLVLKFSEVYFNAPDQKIFSVRINNNHEVVTDLDIFETVGHATAHDEVIPFTIKKGKLSVGEELSSFTGSMKLELVKGHADNPKICAFYIMKGKVQDVPALPMIEDEQIKDDEEDEEFSEDVSESSPSQSSKQSTSDQMKRDKLKSGPPAINPYAEDSSSLILPIIVAFCAFIPALVCLCRL